MKNLKRILSLALASVMVMGMMVVGASAAFNDQAKINPLNADAVNTMVALGVISGKEGNMFDPEGPVTRAQMATMIAVALHGGDANFRGTTVTGFSDVDGNAAVTWAAKYIKYCVDQGIIKGVGGNKFNPEVSVTAQEAATMILTAMGYRAEMLKSNTSDWAAVINQKAEINKLYDDTSVTDYTQTVDRQNAAQMVYNGITAQTPVINDSYSVITGEHTYTVADEGPKSKGDPILVSAFDAAITYGMITGASFDPETGVYTYTVGKDGVTERASDAFKGTELKTTMDVTDLFMQNVKVITAGTSNDVIGITAAESDVVAEGTVGSGFNAKDDAKNPTINGRKVTGAKATTVEIYNFNDSTSTKTVADYDSNDTSKAEAINAICHYAYKLIDNTADGAVDCVVLYPVTVAKVTDLTDETITLDDTTSYDLEEEIFSMPENLQKNDWVIVRDDDILADAVVLELAETVEGLVSARRVAAKQLRIGSTWYTPAGTITGACTTISSTTERRLVMVNGYYAAVEDITEEEAPELNMIVVTELAIDKTFSDFEGYLAANVMFLSDGTTDTIKLEADYLTAPGTADGTTKPVYNGVKVGGIYTYSDADRNGKMEVEAVDADAVADVYDDLKTGKLTLAASGAKATMDSTNISDTAVVYAIYTNSQGTLKIETKTGKQVKAWAADGSTTTWGADTSVGFAKTVNGLEYIQLMVLVGDTDENALPDAAGSKGNYGYVLTNPYQIKEGSTTYLTYDIWTGTETITVKDTVAANIMNEAAEGETATVKLAIAAKNDVITYEDKGDGVITLEGKIATKAAVTGYSAEDGIIKLADAKAGVENAAEKNITDGTTIIFVNKKDGEGVRSGSIKLATKDTANAGEYLCNVVYAADENGNVTILVVDTNNAMGGSTKAD